ncbi:MAG: hypothetical protein IRZ09_14590 [Variibacter sp.]|nr:hypothetical protein [Variibacter sp.]
MSLFDGLPDAFVETFGEEVVYTPAATGVAATITAIWMEEPVAVALEGEAGGDDVAVTLHLRAADVPAPAEGDRAQRVATGRTMRVVPPIRPDGQGMIVCTLEAVD